MLSLSFDIVMVRGSCGTK